MAQIKDTLDQGDQIAVLLALQEIAQNLAAELDLEALLEKVVESAVMMVQASAGSLLIWESSGNELVFAVAKGGGGEALVGMRMPAYKGIAGWVLTNQRSAIASSVRQDPRFFSAIDESLGFHTSSLLAVPLLAQGEAIGVLEVLNKVSQEPFVQQDADLLMALAGQAAVAIKNARLYRQVQDERDRIIALEEQVRKDMARELHDVPAQMLSAIIMHLCVIEDMIPHDAGQAVKEVKLVQGTASKALQQIRSMIFELRPVILQTQGLIPALRTYVKRLSQTVSVKDDTFVEGMTFHAELEDWPDRLPARIEEICFAIVQEAMSNVKKHAEAKNVWLQVTRQNDLLTINIRDDGKGFEVSRPEVLEGREGHLGLLNMHERAEMVGGEMVIRSQPGWGTRVMLTVPLSDLEVAESFQTEDYFGLSEDDLASLQQEAG
jgi:signal transduction histidine kinase